MLIVLFFTIIHAIDYNLVKKDILDILPNPSADSGNNGPRLIRLAWHCSGTYRTTDGRGGCDGARIRFDPELHWADNAGQAGALKILEPIKIKYGDELSWGDLIILAANVAIYENGNGPEIKMCTGKVDVADGSDSEWLKPTSITSQTFLIYVDPHVDNATQIRKVFGYMDMNDTETVALIGGGHAFGKCHAARSGFEGAWTTDPTHFDNQFFRFLIDFMENNMTYAQNDTTKQWDSVYEGQKVLMLTTDLALTQDDSYESIVRDFADDFDYYEDMFQHSWAKLVYRDFGNKPCAENPVTVPDIIENYDETFWNRIANDISHIYLNAVDGNMEDAPLFVRLAWQCAGTYRGTDYRGGCDGARIRFEPESTWDANKGIDRALELLRSIKENYNETLSWADLIILAGTTALKDLGAMDMPFCPGRIDVTNSEEAAEGSKYLETSFLDPETGRVGDSRPLETQIRDRASMMNFTLREMVALTGGGHSIGKCHSEVSGYSGQWTKETTDFDNSWFKNVLMVQDSLGSLDQNWELKTFNSGKSQFVNKQDPSLAMLHSDIAFTSNPVMRKIVTDYAGNNTRFLVDFRDVWLKLVNSDRYGNVCESRGIPAQSKTDEGSSKDKDYLSNLAIVLISLLSGFVFCLLLGICCMTRKAAKVGGYNKFSTNASPFF